MLKNIVLTVIGFVAIVIGCVGKNFYYAKSLQAAVASDKPAPIWLGRALFLLFGTILVVVGLKHLFSMAIE
jgi:hypothetical protein